MAGKVNPPPPIGGIINCLKPIGPSSFRVTSQVRKQAGIKKIGHCGTLDPFADGVLPLALGRATNMIYYMEDYEKVYRVLLCFGEVTDTMDLSGTCVQRTWLGRTEMEKFEADDFAFLREGLESFRGSIQQETPAFSAAKVKGKPMYEYARAGEPVSGAMRQITVSSLDLIAAGTDRDVEQDQLFFLDPAWEDLYFPGTVRLEDGLDQVHAVHQPQAWALVDVHCSKGTYIRSLVHDLGQKLGFGAYAGRLRRLQTGPFRIEEASVFTEILEADLPSSAYLEPNSDNPFLLSAATARPDYPVLELDRAQAVDILQGKIVYGGSFLQKQQIALLYHQGCFLGLGRQEIAESGQGMLVAERMFTSLENFTSRSVGSEY